MLSVFVGSWLIMVKHWFRVPKFLKLRWFLRVSEKYLLIILEWTTKAFDGKQTLKTEICIETKFNVFMEPSRFRSVSIFDGKHSRRKTNTSQTGWRFERMCWRPLSEAEMLYWRFCTQKKVANEIFYQIAIKFRSIYVLKSIYATYFFKWLVSDDSEKCCSNHTLLFQ